MGRTESAERYLQTFAVADIGEETKGNLQGGSLGGHFSSRGEGNEETRGASVVGV